MIIDQILDPNIADLVQAAEMVAIKHRRVKPAPSGHRSFNELQDASTLLEKKKAVPAEQQLKPNHNPESKKAQRKGQFIDILV